mmetsp:Transcript_43530/g.68982  ORF Transcript_43530/g.68982 Transcript_43530/m.68982 type:complete len:217 (-) Transcript_43530:658-1308(-)
MCIRCLISWLDWICLSLAPRTFNSFPFRGNTPKFSRPTVASPATARALAESPSVKIRVQLCPFFPAFIASSSLAMEGGGPDDKAVCILRSRVASMALMTASNTPSSATVSMNSLDKMRSKPNLCVVVVSRVFVCESKSGLSTRTLTMMRKYCFTVASEGRDAPCCATISAMRSVIWSVTCLTCVPRLQRMPLTKPSAAKPAPWAKLTATSALNRPC